MKELYFEGPEKKLELTALDVNFLEYPDVFWKELVEGCGALILSEMSSPEVKSFLLSESSLFVWKDKVLMITCGQTQLIKSAGMLINKVGVSKVESFYFERKNEYYPEYQKSFALQDFRLLKDLLGGGQAYRFGNKDDHHLYLFEYGNSHVGSAEEHTLEVLIYGICEDISAKFLSEQKEDRVFLEQLIKNLFPDFKLDQHWFEPCGYSMNALRGDSYATIHVTPEKEQSYISFEMNNVDRKEVLPWIDNIYKYFGPRSFDLIYYDSIDHSPLELDWKEMQVRQKNHIEILAQFGVSYYHWEKVNTSLVPPVGLNI